MKKCPKCDELIGDNVTSCFNCFYDFNHKRVLKPDEVRSQREKEAEKILEKQVKQEELVKQRETQIAKNPMFEYQVEVINDNLDGTVSDSRIQGILSQYSQQGWRLHSVAVNEVGKSATGTVVGFLGSSINATIDQTILVFERCIKS